MKIIKTKNYADMTHKTIDKFLKVVDGLKNKERTNIALTGGNSPKLFYELIIEKINSLDFLDKLHFYNFDELPLKDDLSTGITIKELIALFFNKANIKESNIHKLNVLNYKEHMDQIERDGGLDLVLLGLGTDGHFCGNMSGVTKFGDKTRLIKNVDFRKNAKIDVSNIDFDALAESYVTMGPRDIMNAKEIIMIANGKSKVKIIDLLLNGPVVEDVPATILTLHPFFTLILDEEANSIAKR